MPRKLGIITPEVEANTLAAKRVIAAVKKCGGAVTDGPYTYESNINTATQQTETTVHQADPGQGHDRRVHVRPDRPGVPHRGHERQRLLPRVPAHRRPVHRRRPGRPALRQAADAARIRRQPGPQQVALDVSDPARGVAGRGQLRHTRAARTAVASTGPTSTCSAPQSTWRGPNLTPLTFEKGSAHLCRPTADGRWASPTSGSGSSGPTTTRGSPTLARCTGAGRRSHRSTALRRLRRAEWRPALHAGAVDGRAYRHSVEPN